MFIGHYGPAALHFRSGKSSARLRLWEAFLAVQAIDIVCGLLMVVGIENIAINSSGKPIFVIPWSHSLLTSIALSVALGGMYKIIKPQAGNREFVLISLLVFSHWILDLVVHRPDLPLYPGGNFHMGLSLWDYPWIAFILEAGLLGLGLAYWQKYTVAKHKIYDVGIWFFFIVAISLHFGFVVIQGIEVKNEVFEFANILPSRLLGGLMLLSFLSFACTIAVIERGRSLVE